MIEIDPSLDENQFEGIQGPQQSTLLKPVSYTPSPERSVGNIFAAFTLAPPQIADLLGLVTGRSSLDPRSELVKRLPRRAWRVLNHQSRHAILVCVPTFKVLRLPEPRAESHESR